jgi:hypothetical protein
MTHPAGSQSVLKTLASAARWLVIAPPWEYGGRAGACAGRGLVLQQGDSCCKGTRLGSEASPSAKAGSGRADGDSPPKGCESPSHVNSARGQGWMGYLRMSRPSGPWPSPSGTSQMAAGNCFGWSWFTQVIAWARLSTTIPSSFRWPVKLTVKDTSVSLHPRQVGGGSQAKRVRGFELSRYRAALWCTREVDCGLASRRLRPASWLGVGARAPPHTAFRRPRPV